MPLSSSNSSVGAVAAGTGDRRPHRLSWLPHHRAWRVLISCSAASSRHSTFPLYLSHFFCLLSPSLPFSLCLSLPAFPCAPWRSIKMRSLSFWTPYCTWLRDLIIKYEKYSSQRFACAAAAPAPSTAAVAWHCSLCRTITWLPSLTCCFYFLQLLR